MAAFRLSALKFYEGEIARIKGELEKESDGGPAYLVYQDESSERRWRLRAGNNRIIADSAEGCDKQDCLHAISLVKDSKNAPVKDRL